MFQIIWNILKYFIGILQRVCYPAKRLICRRRKLSASDAIELTSIGTGDGFPMTNSVSGSLPQNEADLEMESWDSWGDSGGGQGQGQQQNHNNYYNSGPPQTAAPSGGYGGGHDKPSANGHRHPHQYTQHHHHHHQTHQQRKLSEAEPEVEVNFFEDMTPAVQKQKKFLIHKKDPREAAGFSNRLAVMSDIPMQTSELESWEDTGGNAWEDNADTTEDMTWQAEEAIREKKKKDRMERQMEQQKKKQKRDEMRGMKGGSLAATKLS